jgi:hypothetical protein
MGAPLYRLEPDERWRRASAAVGHLARITVHPIRRTDTDPFVVTGRAISVASLYGGAGSAIIVVRDEAGYDRAFSLATIAAVEVVS